MSDQARLSAFGGGSPARAIERIQVEAWAAVQHQEVSLDV
jgi:hypothetical protein